MNNSIFVYGFIVLLVCAASESIPFDCQSDFPPVVPQSFVADGICDCCNGLDEPPEVKCKDTCQEKELAEVEALRKQLDVVRAGLRAANKQLSNANSNWNKLVRSANQKQQEVKEYARVLQSNPKSSQAELAHYAKLFHQQKKLKEMVSNEAAWFGRDNRPHALAALIGVCKQITLNEKQFKGGSFEPVAQDYVFEVCPFGMVRQWKPKSTEDKVILGKFSKIEKNIMVFNDGDQCWGTTYKRSTKVTLQCGATDRLISFEEDGKCLYYGVFETPMMCERETRNKLKKSLSQRQVKDEL